MNFGQIKINNENINTNIKVTKEFVKSQDYYTDITIDNYNYN